MTSKRRRDQTNDNSLLELFKKRATHYLTPVVVLESETVTRTSQSSYPSEYPSSYQTYDDTDSAETTHPNVIITSSSLASNSGAFSSSSSIASEVSCSRSNQAGFHPSLVVTIDSSSDSEDNYCDQIDGTEKVVVDLDEEQEPAENQPPPPNSDGNDHN